MKLELADDPGPDGHLKFPQAGWLSYRSIGIAGSDF